MNLSTQESISSKADERRHDAITAAINVIAREGIEAATIRRIANEIGSSTATITYYFANKHELLLASYRKLGEFSSEKFAETIASDPADLVGYLVAMTAGNLETMARWRMYIAIWDTSLRDPALAAELQSWTDATLVRIETLIDILAPGWRDKNDVARRLIALVQGISVQRLFDQDSWTTDKVHKVLRDEVRLVLRLEVL